MKHLLLILALAGCNNPPYHKPFIVYIKGEPRTNGYVDYKYFDRDGKMQWIEEKYEKYSIGDTIK